MGATAPRVFGGVGNSSESRPNFLIILTDDQTYRAIGYTNSLVQTPHLTDLASQGIVFENAYVASPICVASRASLLTGIFPQQHGSVGLDGNGFRQSVIEDKRYRTPAHLLGEHGYLTGFAGKSHLGSPRDYGFQAAEEFRDIDDHQSFAFASRFLKERASDRKPFLFWLGAKQPHIPLQPGEEWLALYRDKEIPLDPNFRESPPEGSLYNQGLPGERYYRESEYPPDHQGLRSGPPRTREQAIEFIRAYYATISHLDKQIGDLVAGLRQAELLENTLIVFLSDNGYHLGNHGLGNKITMHEESVRVPMFVRWGRFPARGVRCRELVSSLDLFPTLMELAGVPAPGWLEGRSLAPLFHEPERAIRECVFSECVGVGGKRGMGHRMARAKRWKYILTDTNEEALFDEESDPYEMRNLASLAEHRATLSGLREELRDWMTRVGDTHAPPPSG
ncbi:MAG: Arylsulfatase [bacterium]|nr:Arylsulfatase [bacterium]